MGRTTCAWPRRGHRFGAKWLDLKLGRGDDAGDRPREPENLEAARQLADLLEHVLDEGTIYLGYPVLATADDRVEIDALLVSQSRGLIAFRFADAIPETDNDWIRLSSEQDRIFNALESHLSRHDTLRRGRKFAIDIVTVTVFATPVGESPVPTEAVFLSFDELPVFIGRQEGFSADLYRSLQAALQRVSTIRPAKRRAEVKSDNSRGAAMKVIERGIANLDFWQKKAAIETPDGPQRIRGLAGSGKTIVLALKAALLHAQNDSWKIGVTFWSQSLYQQFEDLIKRFSFAHMDDLPDPEQLLILHAWGTRAREGMYTRLADALGVQPVNFGVAERKYGRDGAFEGVCQELLTVAKAQDVAPIFDAILIDEAQDLPPSFFRLLYVFTKDPKRIVWAYDELQKLDESEMASVAELFGTTATGDPVVNTTNRQGEPRRDVVLPVCYRNTPGHWQPHTPSALASIAPVVWCSTSKIRNSGRTSDISATPAASAALTISGASSIRYRPAGISIIPPPRRVTASTAATNAGVELDPPARSAPKSSTTSTIMVDLSLSWGSRFKT
jgi:superfamily I DNA and RNA helicase